MTVQPIRRSACNKRVARTEGQLLLTRRRALLPQGEPALRFRADPLLRATPRLPPWLELPRRSPHIPRPPAKREPRQPSGRLLRARSRPACLSSSCHLNLGGNPVPVQRAAQATFAAFCRRAATASASFSSASTVVSQPMQPSVRDWP